MSKTYVQNLQYYYYYYFIKFTSMWHRHTASIVIIIIIFIDIYTCFTLSCIGSMWQIESRTSLG